MVTKRAYVVGGMDCAEEVEALKGTVGRLPGVTNLTFHLLAGTISLDAETSVTDRAILEAIRRAGLKATPVMAQGVGDHRAIPETFWEKRGRLMTCMGSGVLLAAGLAATAYDHGSLWSALGAGNEGPGGIPAFARAAYLGAVLLGGWHTAPKAAASLSGLRPDMNLLMTIAVLGAAAIGEWFEAGTVSFLFAFSLLLESWSVSRARHAIQSLTQLSPAKARYVSPDNGAIVEAAVSDVPVGMTVLVRPGERISLDGIIREGTTTVNEAPITGESRPVSKVVNDSVLAGTINNEGAIAFQVTKPSADTTLARIIRMVEEAQSRRAPVEQWVDRFARYYTPVMIVFAVLVAVGPPLLLGGDWAIWFYEALVMLVIACPCALVISTPVGIVAGLASAARNGVLIKGGVHLETASRLKAIAIDKTGTLTEGRPEVQTILSFDRYSPDDVLARAAALETQSAHPIAGAICRKAMANGIQLGVAREFMAITGRGAEGTVAGERLWIGSHRLMHERAADAPTIHAEVERLEDAGHSVVVLGSGNRACGLISVADRLRPAAAEAIAALHDLGIRHITMITGDNEGTAAAVAQEAGVDAYHAELLPEDKMKFIHALAQDYEHVGMVGDGVNDAPAMAASSLAVAMGAAGSDAAIETADVALMADDLAKLPWLVSHARRTMTTIRTNVIFALGLKATVMILAIAGMATLWMAIAADMGASLIVVSWSLRLLKHRT